MWQRLSFYIPYTWRYVVLRRPEPLQPELPRLRHRQQSTSSTSGRSFSRALIRLKRHRSFNTKR
jgi:hypothetical protein